MRGKEGREDENSELVSVERAREGQRVKELGRR